MPVGKTETVTMRYNFPKEFKKDIYNLLIQKQSGVPELPMKITVKKADGSVVQAEEILKEDKMFSF